eukprot:GEMP01045275.1.p1 GENE.GEMP01045275.1~~GEMP01045275.1.p1  ORF type:complete len:402 (+),score=105.44 GEMP01045275.1:195-1400(+)
METNAVGKDLENAPVALGDTPIATSSRCPAATSESKLVGVLIVLVFFAACSVVCSVVYFMAMVSVPLAMASVSLPPPLPLHIPDYATIRALRYNWTNLPLTTSLARSIRRHQEQCAKRTRWHMMNNFGLGSDIHTWSQALCNAMEENVTLAVVGSWIWRDEELCSAKETTSRAASAPLACYFEVSTKCASADLSQAEKQNWQPEYCPHWIRGFAFRAAAVEYLFSNVSPALVRQAEQTYAVVFGDRKSPLITVHIRWGDKKKEMELVPIEDYVEAVSRLLIRHDITDTPILYISTEDPSAAAAFKSSSPRTWEMFTDHMVTEMQHIRPKRGNHAVTSAMVSHGMAGSTSLASLLLAMESQYYVLTTGSNWSRLINELRTNVVDPRCGNCTDMIDLREGEDK